MQISQVEGGWTRAGIQREVQKYLGTERQIPAIVLTRNEFSEPKADGVGTRTHVDIGSIAVLIDLEAKLSPVGNIALDQIPGVAKCS